MKHLIGISILACVVGLWASGASADWAPNYKMHWPQLPDLSPTGIDVDNTWVTLADDFKCIEDGPITDVHIWASFADDMFPAEGVDSLTIKLSIHADIPAGQQEPWSMPGPELWSKVFGPGQYKVVVAADDIIEDWYDPATELYLPGNHQWAFQYNFYIDPAEAFEQKYCNTYWLDMKVIVPDDPDFTFGWKTTKARHPDLRWNDDAVWQSPTGAWLPLTYPQGHEYYPESLDLAFVITPEPATMGLLLVGSVMVLLRRRRT